MTRQSPARTTRAAMSTRTRITNAALLTAVLSLTACGGDDTPAEPTSSTPLPVPTYHSRTKTNSPSGSGTATASGTTGATQTPVPAAAKQHTKDGAKAFAEYYVTQIGLAYRRGSGDTLRPLYAPTCKACAEFARIADDFGARSYHPQGPVMEPYLVEWMPEGDLSRPVVDVLAKEGPYKVVSKTDEVIATVPAGKLDLRYHLRWTSGGWQVAESFLVQ